MRILSISFIALAVLALAPASDAQQNAQIRKANILAKSQNQKMMTPNTAKARGFARFQAWQKSSAAKSQKSAARIPSNVSLQKGTQGVAGKSKNMAPNAKQFKRFDNWKKNVANKSKSMKATKVGHHSKAAPAKSLKQEYGKRYKIKKAVKALLANRQQAALKGKAAMSNKQR